MFSRRGKQITLEHSDIPQKCLPTPYTGVGGGGGIGILKILYIQYGKDVRSSIFNEQLMKLTAEIGIDENRDGAIMYFRILPNDYKTQKVGDNTIFRKSVTQA
jgi:hypothetical protein